MEEMNLIEAESEQKRHIRHRKKELFRKIRSQMEFYFSNSNLSHDRYTAQLIKASEQGCKE